MHNILYAAHFRDLNDPMEGSFDGDYCLPRYQDEILKEMNQIRICSLSKNMSNPLMWAHYADGFRGICIELEIDESKLDLREITYSPFTPIPSDEPAWDYEEGEDVAMSTKEWAIVALNGKYEDWEYEEEWRIFSEEKYIDQGCRVTAVYFGTRTSSIYKNILRKIIPEGVLLIETKVSESLVNKVVPV